MFATAFIPVFAYVSRVEPEPLDVSGVLSTGVSPGRL